MPRILSKSDYVVRSLSKIKYKKWELYVVSRIIHLLGDLDIEFVCQQQVRKKDGGCFLTDLFFPQFDLYLEIDEAQHFGQEPEQLDKLRRREIWEVSSISEERISVYDKEKAQYRDINDINKDIDTFLSKIRLRKRDLLQKNRFEPWDPEYRYDPNRYISRGYIDANENVILKSQVDVLRIFGARYKGWQKGWWNVKETNKAVWFPRLYTHRDWTNELSEDEKIITETKTDGSALGHEDSGKSRIVFGHYSNVLGQIVYKFVGEFQHSKENSTSRMHTHNLVSSRLELPVS